MKHPDRRPIVILSGPTAAGKTETALRLAEDFDMEIVNADSMQVYRLLDIGTAKPTLEQRLRVPHHLIDIVNPDEPFDAGTYQEKADEVIEKLWSRRVIPLVVGGTGLYIRALIRGLCKTPEGGKIEKYRREEIRRQLKKEFYEKGLKRLYEELQKVDPELASKIHPSDTQRIIRGLEVFMITGIPLSRFQKRHRFAEERYSAIKIFLFRDKAELKERINQRVLTMIERGLCEEVQHILELGYSPELKPLKSIGYRQIIAHLKGKITLDDAIRDIQKETRLYAKRQFTWFRKEPGFQWIHIDEEIKLWKLVEKAL